MITMKRFSWRRLIAMARKEFVQMRRDRVTFGMIIGIPFIQLIVFGFAIKNYATIDFNAPQ